MDKKLLTSVIFNTLRILHSVTPQDSYLTHYHIHRQRSGDEFFDLYHLCWQWGAYHNPKKIIEIGVRTGLSLAQLLSSCEDYAGKRVVLFDRFDDGLSCPDLVRKHLIHLGIPTDFLEFHTGDSAVTVPEFKATNTDLFDWILVDGAHTPEYLTLDLNNIVDLVATGGVIVVDDIASTIDKYGFNLRPSWNQFREEHYEQFNWFEDHTAKGTGWAVRK